MERLAAERGDRRRNKKKKICGGRGGKRENRVKREGREGIKRE